jgi:serine/threonine protein kinase
MLGSDFVKNIINTILKQNTNLFGINPKIEKINVGFTNTIYNINDSFIVKICTNINNEIKFQKEIDFYKTNRENNLIPKLYYSNTDKKDIPYFYEIIEKVDGVSLYNVWHTFSEKQMEEIIKQLCIAMKSIHSNIGESYDWTKEISDSFASLYEKAKKLNIFNQEELKLLDYAYAKFEKYLASNDFVLIHNDLHFDNILFSDGKIKLIDFERSMYAPRDFELDILYRMIRKPWKFASEETEQYTNLSHYSNIMTYIEKYYPEIVNIPNLYRRLAIYDIVYFLKHLIQHPDIEELKNDVLFAAKKVALEDEIN